MTRPDHTAPKPPPADKTWLRSGPPAIDQPPRRTVHVRATLPEVVAVGMAAAYPALTGAPWAVMISATTAAAALGVWRIWRLLALQAAAADEEADDDE